MRFGITTPIVTLVPRSHAPWEVSAGREELRRIAEAVDRLGFHHLSCSEHVGIPVEVAAVRGGRYYDPLATLGFIAALTERVRLLTHVVVLPYHHPLTVAKRFGTLDRLSAGRVILGLGVGSLKEEFDLLGVDFDGRGPRFEDALRALRASLGQREPQYAGTHYRFSGFLVDPPAVQAHVPIWLGGRSPRSLRRALRLADGWDPFRLTREQLADLLYRAREWSEWHERSSGFALVFSPDREFDISDASQRAALTDTVAGYEKIGTTVLNLRFRHRSLQHYLDQLGIFASQIGPRFAR
jgi:probable F420-dependent oxidoreductase